MENFSSSARLSETSVQRGTIHVERSWPKFTPLPGKFFGKWLQNGPESSSKGLLLEFWFAESILESGVDAESDFDPLAMGGVAPTRD